MVDAPRISARRAGPLFDPPLGGQRRRADAVRRAAPAARSALSSALVAALALAAGGCGDNHGPSVFTRAALLDPTTCKDCHPQHLREWEGSMHAYASRDPVFLAMNQRGQEETRGALGSFCVNCHAPMAVREGATTDGLNLADVPASLQGVGCYFCHNVEAVEGVHDNPLRLANDTTMRGRIADPVPNPVHHSAASPLHSGADPRSAALCGACHDLVLPVPPAPMAVELERTFKEWHTSVFAPAQAPVASAVATCNSCHMPFGGTPEPVAEGHGLRVVTRDRHPHHLAAVDLAYPGFPYASDPADDEALREQQRDQIQRLLDITLRVDICVQELPGDTSAIQVTLDNANAGHNWPSGASQDRRAWVEVIAYKDGQRLYQSGVVPDDQPVAADGDPDLWLFRDRAFNASGGEAHMFWDIARIEPATIGVQVTNNPADSRFYTASHAIRRFPLRRTEVIAGVPDRVTARIRIRPIDFDVLDDLIASGHLDRRVRGLVPTFDVLPNRALAVPHRPQLAGLGTVSLEWSEATRTAGVFFVRQDLTTKPPQDCIGMPRQP